MEPPSIQIKTLLIDNYDSYTFNLFQALAQVNGIKPDVIRNNQVPWETLKPTLNQYHNIVISPGPGIPSNPSDFGICENIIKEIKNIPILGVCLGHQGIAYYFGGKVILANQVAHGVVSLVTHNQSSPLFQDIPSPFEAVRYHSWIVSEENFPDCLEPIAWTDSKIIMALRHKNLPIYGVQFHPESICTKCGIQILQNFRNITLSSNRLVTPNLIPLNSVIPPIKNIMKENSNLDIIWKKFKSTHSSETWFLYQFSQTKCPKFWLDSSRIEPGLSRFSFMGDLLGPNAFLIQYDVHKKQVTKNTYAMIESKIEIESSQILLQNGRKFFDYMQNELNLMKFNLNEFPFEFNCGLIGYFGYEMKHECDSPTKFQSRNPDAAFIFADRFIAFDHQLNETYFVSLIKKDSPNQKTEAEKWIQSMIQFLQSEISESLIQKQHEELKSIDLQFSLYQSYNNYKENTQSCLNEITRGESYELCLTNRVLVNYQPDPYKLFSQLRKNNPAPYSAFLQFDDFSIVSCSPEKFLTISRKGEIECKPIKGTARRGKTKEEDQQLKQILQTSKKDFSENLMIADLIRNDIGKVCEIGSIHVPKLMNIESYSTVHQLVTTVSGQLRNDLTPIDCITQSFPPGSMTGAPKLRSMEILERLEKNPRGVYSGILGFIGLNGACDFSVIIRTAVIDKQGTYIGCGGAIVTASDIEEEFQEILLKANALIRAIGSTVLGASFDPTSLKINGVPSSLSSSLHSTVNTTIHHFDGALYLRSLSLAGMDLGLNRIKQALIHLGNPHSLLKIIHITGTNGKGSVCAYLTSILKEAGFKVGSFTSPHFIHWRETIMINNEPVSIGNFNELIHQISEVSSSHSIRLTQFETLTAGMYWYFAFKEKVDIAVIEVGLGGTHDATNVCENPLVSILVSIGMDHMNVLGNSLASIAKEKSGIIKPNCPVITSNEIAFEAKEQIELKIKETKSKLILVSSNQISQIKDNPREITFQNITYPLKLNGEFQKLNSAISVQAILEIRSQGSPWNKIQDQHIIEGMKKVKLLARLQKFEWKNKQFLLDGAHNVPAGKELSKYIQTQIRKPNQPLQWIIGMLSTKDHFGFLSLLFQPNDSVIFVPVRPNVDWLKSIDPNSLKNLTHSLFSSSIQISVEESVEKAMHNIQPLDPHTPIIISGSLHLCGQVLQLIQNEAYKILETILYDSSHDSFFLLDQHLQRLQNSAHFFGFPVEIEKIKKQLNEFKSSTNIASSARVRLLLDRDGIVSVEHTVLGNNFPTALNSFSKLTFQLKLAKYPISSGDIFLQHKTTLRTVYDQAFLEKGPSYDDVVLFNEKNQITETTICNLAIQNAKGEWVTPSLSSGLLPGIMRAELLKEGKIIEGIITIEELKNQIANTQENFVHVLLFNSVRGLFYGNLKID